MFNRKLMIPGFCPSEQADRGISGPKNPSSIAVWRDVATRTHLRRIFLPRLQCRVRTLLEAPFFGADACNKASDDQQINRGSALPCADLPSCAHLDRAASCANGLIWE